MSLLTRLRRRTITARTPLRRAYWMRAYLRHKARLGRWDDRMLTGPDGRRLGGDITGACRRFIMRALVAGLVPTSTTGGQHAPTSHHYSGRAVDVGLRPHQVGTRRGRAKLIRFQRQEARHPERYAELFGPDNHACVKDRTRITLREGTPLEDLHDNHVHGAPA